MFSGTRGDKEGAKASVSYAGCICQRDTWRRGLRGGIQDVTRCPIHGEGSLDPAALLSLRTRRRLRCPRPCPPHAWKALPLPEAEETRLPKQTPGPRVALLVSTGHPGSRGARPTRARRTARASVGRAGGRPRSLAPARSPWQRARGGRGRGAAAAISAASCSLRPRRHGNGVPQPGRLSARLARVTPAARAPSSPSRTLPGARGRQGGRLMGDAY